MGSLVKKSNGGESGTESRESIGSPSGTGLRSDDSIEEVKKNGSFEALLGWPIRKAQVSKKIELSDEKKKAEGKTHFEDLKFKNAGAIISEIEMMKERFAKVLLGEDMSGSGKGVCTALAISNAITNLYATIFGQLWRLEPLPSEKKSMWKREMEWLICVSDRIVEFIPSWQTFPDGRKLEVMTCRQRSDLFINLPALRTLDNILIEVLDSFRNTEFWYVDQGITSPEADGSASFRETLQRQEQKWWLPVPRVPPGGLTESLRKQLNHTRECTNQILKAAMAINSIALGEMEVPESYLETLPKNGRACLGEFIYRYITSDHFSADCLLDCLDLSSEHIVLDIANRVEATIYVWRRRTHSKPLLHPNRSTTKSSWGMVKDLMVDGDKREMLAKRAESLLLCLKQRFPSLPQTTLDTSKIQCNTDVGKSILESYSRVLESLAFNIVAHIDDLTYVDDLSKTSDKLSSVPTKSMIAHKKVSITYSVPVSGTPIKSTLASPNCLFGSLTSPTSGERTPFLHNSRNQSKPQRRGMGVKRVLTNYLGAESKAKISGNPTEESYPITTNGTEDKENRKNSPAQPDGTKMRQNQPRYMVT